ncbi:unnamed protein product, partial [Rotaria sp. Silwood2]
MSTAANCSWICRTRAVPCDDLDRIKLNV